VAVTEDAPPGADERAPARTSSHQEGRRLSSPLVLSPALVPAVLARSPMSGLLGTALMQSWMTVFVAVTVPALPFLVPGVLLSAAIAVFVPPSFFARALPRRPAPAEQLTSEPGNADPA
jgi:hypothetical protein